MATPDFPEPARAVALLSGGLDSSVATLLFHRLEGVALAVTIDYGQRSALREKAAAERVASWLGIGHRTVSLPLWGEGGGALLGECDVPSLEAEDLETVDSTLENSAQAVWVPNRNGVFVQVAAAIAEAQGLDRVVVGFNREEAQTFPDNGVAFLEACNRSLEFSTRNRVRLVSPTLQLDKAEIVSAAVDGDLPLEWLWSCYFGGESHCGRCESCRRLQRAAGHQSVSLPRFKE